MINGVSATRTTDASTADERSDMISAYIVTEGYAYEGYHICAAFWTLEEATKHAKERLDPESFVDYVTIFKTDGNQSGATKYREWLRKWQNEWVMEYNKEAE